MKKKNSNGILKSAGNIPVVASIIVLVAFIAGLLLGSLMVAKSAGISGNIGGTFTDGWNAAKAKLKTSSLQGFFMLGEVKSLSGQVETVSGDKVVFSVPLLNPLWDASLKTRTAVIGSATTITVSTQLAPEVMQANRIKAQTEMTDFSTAITALNTKLAKCAPAQNASSTCAQEQKQLNDLQVQSSVAQRLLLAFSTDATGTISNIATGDNINVISDSDISEAAQFTAKQIIITKNFVPPASVPKASSTVNIPSAAK